MVKNATVRGIRSSPGKSPARSKRRSLSSRSGPSSGSVSSAPQAKSANINVAVRVRPENDREKTGAYDNIISVIDRNMLIFDPKDNDDECFFFKGKKQGRRDLNKKAKKDKTFTFDNIYDADSTNQEIFEGTTKNVVGTLMEGYNCCVFAYGATGAGKTFTMLGAKDKPGIIYLTMKEIFSKVEETDDTSFDIFMSYLEVYNESIRDLLQDNKAQLNIREDVKNETTIPGLSVHKPKTPDQVLSLLSYGNSNRTQHPTDHNKESSRSHAVLQIIVQQKPKDAGLSAEIKTAKLSMIDLAGSEKGTATGHKGARFREGANINKSLLALGNCINSLASGSKYIPYRDSKLTRLLKDSIGGNCATVMIANVSPSSITYEDTLNTLKYADRAKKIKIDLKKNVKNVDFHIAQYAKIVEDLRTEIVALKDKIKLLELENQELKHGSIQDVEMKEVGVEQPDDVRLVTSLKAQLSALIERQKDYDELQRKVKEFEKQASAEQKKAGDSDVDAELESMLEARKILVEKIGNEKALLSSLELRVHFKRLQDERCDLVCLIQYEKEKSALKTQKTVESLTRKIEKKNERVTSLMNELGVLSKSIADHIANNPDSSTARSAPAQSTLVEHKAENSLLHEVIHNMEAELQRLHGDLCASLPLLLSNEKLLRGHGIQGKAAKDEFKELQNRIQGNQQITWAENLNNSVNTNPELATSIYKQCSRLDFPNLRSRRCSSIEQRKLFADSTLQAPGEDEPDGVSFFPSPVKEIASSVSLNPPSSCSLNPPSASTLNPTYSFNLNPPSASTLNSSSSFNLNPPSSSSLYPPSASIINHTSSYNLNSTSSNNPPDPTKDEASHVDERVDANKEDDDLGVKALDTETDNTSMTDVKSPLLENCGINKDETFELLPATPVIPIQRSLKSVILPPTPQLTRQSSNPPPGNSTTNTSFIGTPDLAEASMVAAPGQPAVQSAESPATKTILSKLSKSHITTPEVKKAEEGSTIRVTPKRLAEDHTQEERIETPEKKIKLDNQAAWLKHRAVTEILDSPGVRSDTEAAENRTFVMTADGNAEDSTPVKGLNETVVLVDRLDQQCDLGKAKEEKVRASHNVQKASQIQNATFCQGDEPMEVDSTMAIADISIIRAPPARSAKIRSSPRSPVRAGLGVAVKDFSTRKSPSPLRQSTLIDLKAGATQSQKPVGSKSGAQVNQGQAKKPVKRTLRTSVSTSALPRQGVLQSQPVSFRSTIQRLGAKEKADSQTPSLGRTPVLTNRMTSEKKGSENLRPGPPKKPTVKRSMSSVFRRTEK